MPRRAVARTITLVSMKHSAQEIRAAAEAAITAKYAADEAKKAYEADTEDESLKTALDTANGAYTTAKAAADALSQEETPEFTPQQIAKMKRRKAIIESELRKAGASDDDEDEDADNDDLDTPITRRDLAKIEADKASASAMQMADAVEDPLAKAAIKEAMKSIRPSGNAAQDFKNAVAIANIDKNSKVLEEIGRKASVTVHRNGAGAPPKPADADFIPTREEEGFMKPPFNLDKAAILAARGTPK